MLVGTPQNNESDRVNLGMTTPKIYQELRLESKHDSSFVARYPRMSIQTLVPKNVELFQISVHFCLMDPLQKHGSTLWYKPTEP